MKTSRGYGQNSRYEIGTVKIRTRKKRNHEQRAYIKISNENKWELLAKHVWKKHNGEIPNGMVIHHIDHDKLNDSIDNLAMMTKAEHLAEHRADFNLRAIDAFTRKRKALKWSTKSKTKTTGRHKNGCQCPAHNH